MSFSLNEIVCCYVLIKLLNSIMSTALAFIGEEWGIYVPHGFLYIYIFHFLCVLHFSLCMYPSKPSCLPKNVTCKRCYKKGNGDQGKSFSKLTSVTYYYNFKTVFLINM